MRNEPEAGKPREGSSTGTTTLLLFGWSCILVVDRHVWLPMVITLPIFAPLAISTLYPLPRTIHRVHFVVVALLLVVCAGYVVINSYSPSVSGISSIPFAILFIIWVRSELKIWSWPPSMFPMGRRE